MTFYRIIIDYFIVYFKLYANISVEGILTGNGFSLTISGFVGLAARGSRVFDVIPFRVLQLPRFSCCIHFEHDQKKSDTDSASLIRCSSGTFQIELHLKYSLILKISALRRIFGR